MTRATANNTIHRLHRRGLVTCQPYRAIFLTEKGRKLAVSSCERPQVVKDALIALGVDAAMADADAEGIEHHASEETLEALRKFPGKKRQAR